MAKSNLVCECCGSRKDVIPEVTLIAHIFVDLCYYCRINKHTPKWLIDGVIDDNGGVEFCAPWLQNALLRAKYCSVRSEGD